MIETTAIPKVNITDLRLCHWIKRLSRNTILRLNETQLLTEDSNVSYNKTRWKHGYDPAQLEKEEAKRNLHSRIRALVQIRYAPSSWSGIENGSERFIRRGEAGPTTTTIIRNKIRPLPGWHARRFLDRAYDEGGGRLNEEGVAAERGRNTFYNGH